MKDPEGSGEGVTAYVALGSNLGDRDAYLALALRRLDAHPEVRVEAASSVFETDPVGPPPQGAYLNAVVRLRTGLGARELLALLHQTERAAGRERGGEPWRARTLDLDLLLYAEQRIAEAGLRVPHPRMSERAFVLEPLSELAPDLSVPGRSEKVSELADARRDRAAVRPWPRRLEWRPEEGR